MKGRWRTLTGLLLSACALMGLAACGAKDADEELGGTVYVPEFMEFDLGELGIDYINTGCCDGTYVYVLADANREVEETDPVTGETYTNYEYRTTIFRLALEGGEVTELENFAPLGGDAQQAFDRESYSYIESIRVDADGALWVTESLEEYIYAVPDDFDPETDFMWNYEMAEHTSARVQRKLDESGAEVDRIDTSGLEEKVGIGGDRNGYIGNLLMDGEGNTYVLAEVYTQDSSETKIVVLDPEQNVLFEVKGENLWGNMILLGDGSVGLNVYVYDRLTGEGGQYLRIIDRQTQDWAEQEYPMPVNVGNVYAGSEKYLFYYDNGDSLYGYNAEKEAGEKILAWSSADINRSDLAFFTFLEDGRVAAMTRSWGENGMEAELAVLSEQDASVLADRTVLTYATMYLGYDMREKIIDFNKSQTDYRIEIKDYSEFNTADDYGAGLTKLNTEVIAGRVPDILDTNGLPIRQYGARGLLEDLWPYIENDGELGRKGVMENVLRAAEQDGKLYQVFNSFTIRTAVGAADVVGTDMSWTLEELQAALAAMPEGCTIFNEGDTKESMLSSVMAMQMDNFVDWTTGECYFESDGFMALLEFCNGFPLEYDWRNVDYEDYEDEYTRISNGRQLLSPDYLYDFRSLQIQKYLFGGDVTYVGYPREDGGVGSSFMIEGGLAMSTTCPDKEGAWTFMRQLLLPQSDENEESFYFNGWGFPVNRQDFDRMAEQAMTPYYVLDENGEPMLDENGEPMEQSQGGIGWGDGMMMELYATSQEEYDQIMSLYDAVDAVYSYDEKIYSIVQSVAQRYFNGDITVEAAADQIQSRVKIYVNENL